MRRLFVLLFLILGHFTFGQEKATLRLYINPAAESVSIDGEILESGNRAELEPGQHRIRAWSPNKALLDTVLELKAGETLNFFYRFKNSVAYNQHLAEMNAYNKKRNVKLTLPIVTTTLTAGALAFTYFKGRQLAEQAQEQYDAYQYAGFDIQSQKDIFLETQKKYRQYYYAQFVEYAALAISGYFVYKGIKWVKNNPAPEFDEEKNPITLNRVGVGPTLNGGVGFGLSLNLN